MAYPAIVVFGIMGISGFWLIYSLTSDVHELARNVDPKMERNLVRVSENLSMKAMTANTAYMSRDMGMMNQNVGRPMSFMNEFAPW